MNQINEDSKQKALELLGDNPTEVDVKYVCYALQLSSDIVHQWLREAREAGDIQIELTAEDEKDCEITGTHQKKHKQQIIVKSENQQQQQKVQVQKTIIKPIIPKVPKKPKKQSKSSSKSQKDKKKKDSINEHQDKLLQFQQTLKEKETSYQKFQESMQQLFPQFSNGEIESLSQVLNENPPPQSEHKEQNIREQEQKPLHFIQVIDLQDQQPQFKRSDIIVVEDDVPVIQQSQQQNQVSQQKQQQPQKVQNQPLQQQEQPKQVQQNSQQTSQQSIPQQQKKTSQPQPQVQQLLPQQQPQKINGQNKPQQQAHGKSKPANEQKPKPQTEQKQKPQNEQKPKPQTEQKPKPQNDPKSHDQIQPPQPPQNQPQQSQNGVQNAQKPPPQASPKIIIQPQPLQQPEQPKPQQPQPNNIFLAFKTPEYEAIQQQLIQASKPPGQPDMKPLNTELAQISLFTQQILQQQQQAQQMLGTLSNAYFLLVQQLDSLTNQVLSKK